MPTCPQCGYPRADRYCAQCGAAIVHPRAVAAPKPAGAPAGRGTPPARKKASRAPLILVLLLIGGTVGTLTTLVSHRPVPTASPASITSPRDIDDNLREAETSLKSLNDVRVAIDNRLAHVRMQRDEVFNLRERLAAAMRQARLEDHWPLRVAGVVFDRPSQLQKAIDSADAYLQRARRVEQDLASAAEQTRRAQAAGDRTLVQMQQLRTDLRTVGHAPLDAAVLHDKQAQLAHLNADLAHTLVDAPQIDSRKFDLPPFQLNQ